MRKSPRAVPACAGAACDPSCRCKRAPFVSRVTKLGSVEVPGGARDFVTQLFTFCRFVGFARLVLSVLTARAVGTYSVPWFKTASARCSAPPSPSVSPVRLRCRASCSLLGHHWATVALAIEPHAPPHGAAGAAATSIATSSTRRKGGGKRSACPTVYTHSMPPIREDGHVGLSEPPALSRSESSRSESSSILPSPLASTLLIEPPYHQL